MGEEIKHALTPDTCAAHSPNYPNDINHEAAFKCVFGKLRVRKWEYILCGKDYNQPANMGTMNNQRLVLFINREFYFRPKSSVTVSAG